jgi:uncharacterized damage-inducible protein DinB
VASGFQPDQDGRGFRLQAEELSEELSVRKQGLTPMDHRDFFMKFWNREATATRKVIQRIPEGSDYKPDPKSRTAREIAWLIVREEVVLGDGFAKSVLQWEEIPAPGTIMEVLSAYDRHHDNVTMQLQTADVARWEERMPFTFQGQQMMNETGYDYAWGFLLDIIHHRGQLSTYLRPMGSTVPQIYGPSADEP